jgi:Lar family restriction alleviation protein
MIDAKFIPCPFCGETKRLSVACLGVSYIACSGCHTEGPTADDDVAAIAAWNQRAADAGESELEALRKFAHEATIAITGLTGGGSEFFGKRVGDIYLADLPFCVKRIRETRESLFEAMKESKREARDARSKAEPQS